MYTLSKVLFTTCFWNHLDTNPPLEVHELKMNLGCVHVLYLGILHEVHWTLCKIPKLDLMQNS